MVLSEKTASFILGTVLLLVGAGLLWWGQSEADLITRLKEKGKQVTGSVVNASERKTRSARRGGQTTTTTYHLSVLYTVDAKLHTKDFETNRDGFTEHPAGSKVPVIYDPADPEVADLGGSLSVHGASGPRIGAFVCLVLGLGLFVYGVRAGRKRV